MRDPKWDPRKNDVLVKRAERRDVVAHGRDAPLVEFKVKGVHFWQDIEGWRRWAEGVEVVHRAD